MKYYIVIVIFVISLVSEGAFDLVKTDSRQKRYELDFPTCLENFDIHSDTIIRAQDSRALGGRYINESEVSSREECLKLCCQTSLCDVFIFEEKTPGSCYLFDCGSSDDFKCKFNPHHHYTSGVMAVNRHVAELESQVKLSKHEQELTGLRKSLVAEVMPQSTAVVQSTTSSTTPPSTGGAIIVTTAPTARAATRHCTRYQFECRSTGECIAIYNACDGIPQCSDGSDEGPELACPSAAPVTTSPPLPTHLSVGQPERPLNPQPANWQYQTGQYPVQYPAQFPGVPQPKPQQQTQIIPQLQPPHQQIQRPPPPPPPQQLQQPQEAHKYYGRTEETGSAPWPPQPPPNVPQQQPTFRRPYPSEYEDTQNSHIFNHKGSGLISDSESSIGYGEYGASGDNKAYYNAARFPQQQQQQQQQQQWPRLPQQTDHDLAHSMEEELRAGGTDGEQRPPHFGPSPIQSPEHAQNDYYYEEGGAQQRGTFHHHPHPPAVEHGNINNEALPVKAEQIPVVPVTKPPPPPPTTKIIIETTTEHPLETAHNNGHWTGEASKKKALSHHPPPPLDPEPLQDGAAERPGGAYLSLSIGLAVTALLVVLISCRFRVVRRRLRRGAKSPYAHDADFLVNGMYL